MKRLLLILLTFSNFASAFELEGIWILDKDKTTSFNSEYTIQTKLAKTLFACSNGQLIFTKDNLRNKSTSHQCTFKDKVAKIDGYDLEFPYKIIASDKDSIVVRVTGAENYISHGIYHIVNDDTIWVYSGGGGFMEGPTLGIIISVHSKDLKSCSNIVPFKSTTSTRLSNLRCLARPYFSKDIIIECLSLVYSA